MKKFFLNKKINAFTLIELIVVIAIIGILASVIYPSFVNYQKKAQLAKGSYLNNSLEMSLFSDEKLTKIYFSSTTNTINDVRIIWGNIETQDGLKNKAIYFHNDNLNLKTIREFNFGSNDDRGKNDIVISFLFKPFNQIDEGVILAPHVNNTRNWINYSNNRIIVNLVDDGGSSNQRGVISSPIVYANEWHYIVIKIYKNNTKIYINGKLDQDYNDTSGIKSWNSVDSKLTWSIGGRGTNYSGYSSNRFFTGLIEFFNIYTNVEKN